MQTILVHKKKVNYQILDYQKKLLTEASSNAKCIKILGVLPLGMGRDSVGSAQLCKPSRTGADQTDETGSKNRFGTDFLSGVCKRVH
jgi:hypothetical protein